MSRIELLGRAIEPTKQVSDYQYTPKIEPQLHDSLEEFMRI